MSDQPLTPPLDRTAVLAELGISHYQDLIPLERKGLLNPVRLPRKGTPIGVPLISYDASEVQRLKEMRAAFVAGLIVDAEGRSLISTGEVCRRLDVPLTTYYSRQHKGWPTEDCRKLVQYDPPLGQPAGQNCNWHLERDVDDLIIAMQEESERRQAFSESLEKGVFEYQDGVYLTSDEAVKVHKTSDSQIKRLVKAGVVRPPRTLGPHFTGQMVPLFHDGDLGAWREQTRKRSDGEMGHGSARRVTVYKAAEISKINVKRLYKYLERCALLPEGKLPHEMTEMPREPGKHGMQPTVLVSDLQRLMRVIALIPKKKPPKGWKKAAEIASEIGLEKVKEHIAFQNWLKELRERGEINSSVIRTKFEQCPALFYDPAEVKHAWETRGPLVEVDPGCVPNTARVQESAASYGQSNVPPGDRDHEEEGELSKATQAHPVHVRNTPTVKLHPDTIAELRGTPMTPSAGSLAEATNAKLTLIPGGFVYKGYRQDLSGKPLDVIAELCGNRWLTVTATDLLKTVWAEDKLATVDTIRPTIQLARDALRSAIKGAGVEGPADPLPTANRGKGRTAWKLDLP